MEGTAPSAADEPDSGKGRRGRRRAVGPPGAATPGAEPRIGLEADQGAVDDDERLRRDRPPHHDQGV